MALEFVFQGRHRIGSLWVGLGVSLALVAAGCNNSSSSNNARGGGANTSQDAGVSGFVALTNPLTQTVLEQEPNNAVDQAQFMGPVTPGKPVVVFGNTASNQSDSFDSFFFVASERMRIKPELRSDGGSLAGVVMRVYDPNGLQFVENMDELSKDDDTIFHANGAFYVVLDFSQTNAKTNYVMSLLGKVVKGDLNENEPNDRNDNAHYIGQVGFEESFTLAGKLWRDQDVDRFLFSVGEPSSVELDLTYDNSATIDLDMAVYDATTDLNNPILIDVFNSATNGTETGEVSIGGMSLVQIEIRSSAGNSPYTLDVTHTPSSILSSRSLGSRGLSPVFKELTVNHAAFSSPIFGSPQGELMPGEVVVRVHDDSAFEESLLLRGGRELREVPNAFKLVEFDLDPALSNDDKLRATVAAAASLSAAPGVTWAEPNFILRALDEPNDTLYSSQWGYPMIRCPNTWDQTHGDKDIVVAVIDTGSFEHEDLEWMDGYDVIVSNSIAQDGDGPDPDPTDVAGNFHGVHVAGTVGALTDNNTGVAGAAWDVTLMPIRALGTSSGTGTNFDVATGVYFAAGLESGLGAFPSRPADVINMSLGSAQAAEALRLAILSARNSGVVCVAAAGNTGSISAEYPAAFADTISVSALDSLQNRAPYSTAHSTVDLAAPGGDTSVDLDGDGFGDGVLSTWGTNGNSYAYLQGTSMAAPHVSGAAALLLSLVPDATPQEVEANMFSSSEDLGSPGHDELFGHGMVDTESAVNRAQNGAILDFSTDLAIFDPGKEDQIIDVTNLGGQFLNVDLLEVTTDSGGDWLSATAIPVPDDEDVLADLVGIDLRVNRDGLDQGLYRGGVRVHSSGGTRSIQVQMFVVQDNIGGEADLYVLAVDPETDEVYGEAPVTTQGPVFFALDDLPATKVRLVAGSDDNGDGIVAGPEDLYVGEYLGGYVRLRSGKVMKDLEFEVVPRVPQWTHPGWPRPTQ